MVTLGQANLSDREEIEKLIAEYHYSEGLTPIEERIAWAVDQTLSRRIPRPCPSRPGREYESAWLWRLHAFRGAWTRYDCERFLCEIGLPTKGSRQRTGETLGGEM